MYIQVDKSDKTNPAEAQKCTRNENLTKQSTRIERWKSVDICLLEHCFEVSALSRVPMQEIRSVNKKSYNAPTLAEVSS
jgi:hypothetical protein